MDTSKVLSLWQKASRNRLGQITFSKILGRMIPYTGSVDPLVRQLDPGRAVVEMRDSKKIRNHLDCVHALALANLGELSTGLALVSSLPEGTRYILGGLEVEYLKKARGSLVAEARVDKDELLAELSADKMSKKISANIYDSQGDCVARVTSQWVLSKI